MQDLKVYSALEKQVATLQTKAHMLKIVDQATLTEANDALIGIKVLRQEIGKTFKPMKDAAKKTVVEIQAKWDSFDKPLIEAGKIHERNIVEYSREQEKKRREAQARIDEKAKEKAAAAMKELQKEEKKRKEAAREAIKAGDLDKYQELVKEESEAGWDPGATESPTEEALPEAPELTGSTVVRRWKFEIIDPTKIPIEYRKIDEVKIGQYVRAMKESAQIPGVKTYYEDTVTSRTGQ